MSGGGKLLRGTGADSPEQNAAVDFGLYSNPNASLKMARLSQGYSAGRYGQGTFAFQGVLQKLSS